MTYVYVFRDLYAKHRQDSLPDENSKGTIFKCA